MTLTLFDCLAVLALSTVAYLLGYAVFYAVGLWRLRRRRRYHDRVAALIRQHPQFPHNLTAVDSWGAGEFVCEFCGRNGFFSLLKLRSGGDAASSISGEYAAPRILRCSHCRALLANAGSVWGRERSAEEGGGGRA
jgi:hypothetical protein